MHHASYQAGQLTSWAWECSREGELERLLASFKELVQREAFESSAKCEEQFECEELAWARLEVVP